jgi:hypothetical protein
MAARGEEDGGVFFCFGREPRGRELWFFFFFFAKGEVAACADDQEREIG